MKIAKSFIIFLLSVCIAFSCDLEGPQGPIGAEGPIGQTGTANVIYSPWINFQSGTWSALTNFFNQKRRNYPVAVPQITNDILNQGTVAVYVRFSGSSSTPYSHYLSDSQLRKTRINTWYSIFNSIRS